MKIIDHQHRNRIGTIAVSAALLASCGASTTASSPGSTTPDDTTVSVDISCVIRPLGTDDGTSQRVFEEACVYDGQRSHPYPRGVMRTRHLDDDQFTSEGFDGSLRTGSCVGDYLADTQRTSSRGVGEPVRAPGTFQGHQLCTFTGSFIGAGEWIDQDLVETGSMYRTSETSFRGSVTVQPGPSAPNAVGG